ncbi:transposase [Clostridium bovifaecis]|uniref:Transposase n=1 Tax=Clostridium bovifaecis TaxID=2184719 RepID=A0A6I6F0Z9_9CLOT|nr:transposase [Clostridium bovifaecis]
MYIRQECLLSFDEIIKYQPKTRLELILAELDFTNILKDLSKLHATRGPKGHDELALLYSLIAMQIEQITTFKKLVGRLKTDPVFRYTCGFNILSKTPSASTFSRFLTKIANNPSLEKDFESLVKRAKALGLIDGTNVAIDSTKVDAYEKSKPKSKLKNDGKSANWGAKRDTDGNKIRWFGYKLHILVDCKSELPLSILMSPASYSDGDLAMPLIKKFITKYSGVFSPKYYIMDSGYDFQKIYDYITNEVKSQAIIAYNPRGQYAPPEGLNENFNPVCSMGYELTYWGKDGNYLKFRCPHSTGKTNCPYGSIWCSRSNYGYCHKVNYKKNNRYFSYPHRSTKAWQELYNQRTSVERCNSRLKELLNTDNLRSAGIRKAKVIALLNCMALVGGTIALNRKSNDLKNAA